MVDIIIEENCISFVGRKTKAVYFERKKCTEKEIQSILHYVGAYKQKQFKYFGKTIWCLPDEYMLALETELF